MASDQSDEEQIDRFLDQFRIDDPKSFRLADRDPGSTDGVRNKEAATDRLQRGIERLSDLHLVHVGLDGSDQELIVSAPAGETFSPNDTVRVELTRPLWFDADGRRVGA